MHCEHWQSTGRSHRRQRRPHSRLLAVLPDQLPVTVFRPGCSGTLLHSQKRESRTYEYILSPSDSSSFLFMYLAASFTMQSYFIAVDQRLTGFSPRFSVHRASWQNVQLTDAFLER